MKKHDESRGRREFLRTAGLGVLGAGFLGAPAFGRAVRGAAGGPALPRTGAPLGPQAPATVSLVKGGDRREIIHQALKLIEDDVWAAVDRKKRVLILDASREFKKGRAHNELLPEHVERIYGWYRDYQDAEGVARVVTLDDIAANDHNLNIPRYVEPKDEQDVLTVEEAMARLQECARAAFAAEENLFAILKREGLLV